MQSTSVVKTRSTSGITKNTDPPAVRPFLSDKYDLTQHPNYKYTADFDKKYTFDIEKYLNRRLKLKKDEVFDVVET